MWEFSSDVHFGSVLFINLIKICSIQHKIRTNKMRSFHFTTSSLSHSSSFVFYLHAVTEHKNHTRNDNIRCKQAWGIFKKELFDMKNLLKCNAGGYRINRHITITWSFGTQLGRYGSTKWFYLKENFLIRQKVFRFEFMKYFLIEIE
jgi:hypothetical protein